MHTTARRPRAPRTTCGLCTGGGTAKDQLGRALVFGDRKKHSYCLSLTARQIAGNLEVEAMTSDSRPSV